MTKTARTLLRGALVALAVAAVYAPAIRGGWIWDDAPEVTDNAMLRDASGLARIWFNPQSPDYFPLKSTVQWIQWQLWGSDPVGYHLTSAVLHAAAALLLWRILERLGVGLAWFGALAFAVHPVAVESVAWVSEMKNPLSLLLVLLALDRWIASEDAQGRGDDSRGLRWASLGLFAAAMLCKTTVAMLPVFLLLLSWWRRGKIDRANIARAAPFFAVSLVLGAVTVWFQQTRAIAGMDLLQGGPLERLAGAGRAIAFYLDKAAWPRSLMPIYPRWDLSEVGWADLLPWAGPVLAVAWLWARRAGWGRHGLLGLGWFLLNLVPVLGIAPMAYVRISRVADHFAYLSLAGAAGLAAAGLGRLDWGGRWLRAGIAAACLAALAWAARSYVPVFHDEEGLWNYTLGRNPDSWTAHNDLGRALLMRGKRAEALPHFRWAIAINPDDAEAHFNLGIALEQMGRTPDAASEYSEALRIKPSITAARASLGGVLVRQGKLAEGIALLEVTVRANPGDRGARDNLASARNNLGVQLAGQGRYTEAIAQYEAALRLKPANPEADYNLGNALAQCGRLDEALAHLDASLKARPDSVETLLSLAGALAESGRTSEALERYGQLLRIAPRSAEAHNNLGVLLARGGRIGEARAHFEEAVRLKPDFRRSKKPPAMA